MSALLSAIISRPDDWHAVRHHASMGPAVMRKMRALIICFVAITAACATESRSICEVCDEEATTFESKLGSETKTALENFQLSIDLAEYGVANKDAASLILAARISQSLSLRSGGTMRDSKTHHSIISSESKSDQTVVEYLDLAERFAEGNRAQILEIAALRALETKGVKSHNYDLGRLNHARMIEPGAEWLLDVLVELEKSVLVAIVGDGTSALQIRVEDQNSEIVARSPGDNSRAAVEWLSTQDLPYRVAIANLGAVRSYVAIISD